MSGVGITYLWPNKKFPPFIRLEGRRGVYKVYVPERKCVVEHVPSGCGWVERQCSVCGSNSIDDHDKFCPYCGARVVEHDD